MWVPPETVDPVLLHAPTRKSIGLFGAVRLDDGYLVTHVEDRFDAMSFQRFLSTLGRHLRKGRKMIVIVDNARWHHAKRLKPWLQQRDKWFQLDFLPPYSPDLNPIERVWKLTRHCCTHNRYFPTLDDLLCAVTNQLQLWHTPNKILKRLCAIT
jgi:transposase